MSHKEELREDLKHGFDCVTSRMLEDIFEASTEYVAFMPRNILLGQPGLFNVPAVTLKHEIDEANRKGYVCCTKEEFLRLYLASGSKNTAFDYYLKKWKVSRSNPEAPEVSE